MELMIGLIMMCLVMYLILICMHYLVVKLILWLKWDATDWFYDVMNDKNN